MEWNNSEMLEGQGLSNSINTIDSCIILTLVVRLLQKHNTDTLIQINKIRKLSCDNIKFKKLIYNNYFGAGKRKL